MKQKIANNIQKKALVYVRVSSKEQVDGSSLATQQKICEDYSAREGYEIADVYIEEGESAKTTDRTELQKLMKFIKENPKKIDFIIIYKIDRLARNSQDHFFLRAYFKKYGIDIRSATEPVDDSSQGKLMETILAGFAQFSNDDRTERCTNGMISAIKEGRWTWKAPIGYKNSKINGKANLIHDTQEVVSKIRRIWELIDSGYSSEETRKIVNDEGLRTKNEKPIGKSFLYKILRNKLYAGIMEGFGLMVDGTFQPIVDRELFFRVLDKIEGRSNKAPFYKIDNEDFAIRGLVYC
jgi:site-specific DNA recombinase